MPESQKLQNRKHINAMIILCVLVYFTSYISRINFGAVILEMVKADGFLKSEVSLALTASFITYGAGQLISGYLGDRVSPKMLIFFGFLTTAVMNFLIPFCPSSGFMVAIWGINGFAQAMMWPPLVKIMTTMFTNDVYRKATVRVSWGSSLGTIAVYLLSPICIVYSGWRSVFRIASVACIVVATIWIIGCSKLEKTVSPHTENINTDNTPQPENSTKNLLPTKALAFLPGIFIAIILQGALRDGITTWMPTYIAETYNLDSYISILTGVLLPVFSIICFQITLWLVNTKIKNELTCAGSIFGAGIIASALLLIFSSKSAAISVFLSALLTGSMHGVNLILVCMLQPYFKNTSTVSGLVNSFTYVGSALSTYGIALISENFGWTVTIAAWGTLAILGTLCCFIHSQKWSKLTR